MSSRPEIPRYARLQPHVARTPPSLASSHLWIERKVVDRQSRMPVSKSSASSLQASCELLSQLRLLAAEGLVTLGNPARIGRRWSEVAKHFRIRKDEDRKSVV